ncbi:MAG: PP2C family protein-serine/threonine phosphatase, partial [Mycobacterium sp.]
TRTLRYSSAGHPPALLSSDGETMPLRTLSLPLGVFDDETFVTATCHVPPESDLLLYSDGAFEHTLPDGDTWLLADFIGACEKTAESTDWPLDSLLDVLHQLTGGGPFCDDCSLVKLRFH